MSEFNDYQHKYRNIAFERRNGILQVALHTSGGPLKWGSDTGSIHGQLGAAFYDIAHDAENRVMILTGTGNAFCSDWHYEEMTQKSDAAMWYRIIKEGKDLLMQLLDIEVPVIGVINGPATIHAEFLLLSDVILCADDAVLADSHLPSGVVPGDGVHVIWAQLLGPNRARYFFYAEQQLTAREALALGVVGEVMPREKLLGRAWELAAKLAQKPPLALRYSRTLLTQPIKKRLLEDLGYGLSVEGLGIQAMIEGSTH
jgi:enoyl-CoA hydratase/carnithine racemase